MGPGFRSIVKTPVVVEELSIYKIDRSTLFSMLRLRPIFLYRRLSFYPDSFTKNKLTILWSVYLVPAIPYLFTPRKDHDLYLTNKGVPYVFFSLLSFCRIVLSEYRIRNRKTDSPPK